MIRVRAGARLHFGLLSLPAEGEVHWPDRHGVAALPARRFGGVGLMVEAPGVELTAAPATAWSAEGPLAERALAFARRFNEGLPAALPPRRLIVASAPVEHSGLGTGTQLGLAVARALAVAAGRDDLDAVALARRVGRGRRSALGVHGFAHGGFLVEAGKREPEDIAPLVARLPFPDSWRVVLAVLPAPEGVHGEREQQAFVRLRTRPAGFAAADSLCRLVLLGMLPALAEQDLEAFGEALYDFNARVGEMFAAAQGGTYASPAVAEVVAFLRREGVRAVGQSSWGPAVFAIVADQDWADDLAARLRRQFGLNAAEALVTRGWNHGAETGS
jgi:beta-RFAP synthase